MTEPPDSSRIDPAVAAGVRLIGSWLLRLAAMAFGMAIEWKQVYGTEHAQWALVFLGLWFIGVPPALWFDGVWRLARLASAWDVANQQGIPSPPGGPGTGLEPPPTVPPSRPSRFDRRWPR